MKFITENNGKTIRVILSGELNEKEEYFKVLTEILKGEHDFILDFSAQSQISEQELYATVLLARRALGEGTRVYVKGLQKATTSQKLNDFKQDVIDLYGMQTRGKPFEQGGFFNHHRTAPAYSRRK